MGTRGIIAFVTPEGKFKGTYNHFDSYPTGVGCDLQKEFRENPEWQDWASLGQSAESIRFVDSQSKPSAEERAKYAQYWENVSAGNDWYSYLRGAQGSAVKPLLMGVMTDDSDFAQDSLFCEYGYVFDSRGQVVYILEGFNKDPNAQEYEFAKVDRSEEWSPAYSGQERYYGCTVMWSGSMAEFLALDMGKLGE